MRTYFLIIFAATMLLGATDARAQNGSQSTTGYIIKVAGDKIYLNLPNAEVADVVSVFDGGGSITDPKTGRTIRTEPEVTGQIKIIAVQGAYAVGRVYGNSATSLQEGMTVRKGSVIQKDDWGEVTVMIAPAELNFPQGLNTMVKNESGDEGYIGDYVSAALMPHLLESGKIQLIDSSMLGAPQQNSYGDTYSNQAIDYAKEKGARYMVKITMLKPDVVADRKIDLSPGGIVGGVRSLSKVFRTNTTETIESVLPDNMKISKMEVSVKMMVHLVDLQTSRVLNIWNAEGSASGKPSVVLSQWETFGDLSIDGANFTQTITGKAIDNAFKKIGKELNQYFKENL